MGILYTPTAVFSRIRHGTAGFSPENDPFILWDTLFYARNLSVPRRETLFYVRNMPVPRRKGGNGDGEE